MQPSASTPALWGSHGPRRLQESHGIIVPPESSPLVHRCSPSGAHIPSDSTGKFRLSTATTPGHRLCNDLELGRAAGSWALLTYLWREAGPLSCSRSAKRGMGDRMPHSSSTWNCAGARVLLDSSSSLPTVNCRDNSPDSRSWADSLHPNPWHTEPPQNGTQ